MTFENLDPQLARLRSLIDENARYLPGHPHLGLGHVQHFDGVFKPQPVYENDVPLENEEIVSRVQTNREAIEQVAREVTFRVIDILADRLQLDPRYKALMPTVICSDALDDKNLWSAGLEDLFYEMSGSYFIANLAATSRMDYRINRIFGPIIHYSTHEGGVDDVATVIEESLHYLQWINQMPPESLEKIVVMARELGLPNDGRRPAGRIFASMFTAEKDMFASAFQAAHHDELVSIRQELSSRTYEERLAGMVLFEAAAELLKIELGIKEAPLPYLNFERWQERGIPGWTTMVSARADENSLRTDSIDDVRECYQSMKELSWSDFMSEVSRRCGGNLTDMGSKSRQMNLGDNPMHPSSSTVFPQDFVHFLGDTLGQELYRSGIFSQAAGIQQASLTFFSYLERPSVRLRYLIGLLDQ